MGSGNNKPPLTPDQKAQLKDIDHNYREQARQMGRMFGGKWDLSLSRKAEKQRALDGFTKGAEPGPKNLQHYYESQAERAQRSATRPRQQAVQRPGGSQPQGMGSTGLGYQSGFNADRQAVNASSITDRLLQEGRYAPQQGSATGKQAAADLNRSLSMNDAAQMHRGLEKANAQQRMDDQVTRSELMQSGLSNQAKIYADMAQRSIDQTNLAAKLQESMINNRFAFAQALLR
jgi:hypothetical protein